MTSGQFKSSTNRLVKSLVSCAIVIVLMLSCTPAITHGSMIAAWAFDGTAGTATPGTVTDLTANANNLILGGTAKYNANVPFSYVGNTSLDATTAGPNDYAGNDSLTVGEFANNAAWSISAWFKTSTTGSTQQIVSQRVASTGNGWTIALSGGGIPFFFVQGQSGPDGRIAIGASGKADSQWHHAVAVSDPSSTLDANGDGELLLYIDGSLFATDVKVQPNAINYGNSKFAIGSGRDLGTGNYNGYDGLVDEVALYNHALTSLEVSDLYNNSLVPEPAACGIAVVMGIAAIRSRRQRS